MNWTANSLKLCICNCGTIRVIRIPVLYMAEVLAF